MRGELLCLWHLHVATVDTYTLEFQTFSKFVCTVARGIFNFLAPSLLYWLTDCKRKPHELYPSEIETVTVSRASLLYNCSHSHKKSYTLSQLNATKMLLVSPCFSVHTWYFENC